MPNPGLSGAWLLLVFRLPPGSSSGRVSIWRRLKRSGAKPLRGSAWALPDDDESRETLEWLRADVEAEGGVATLLMARPVDARAAESLEVLALGEERPRRDGGRSWLPRDDYRQRLWVTRPRPGVDRMASAWLIRRFVDPQARFVFAERPEAAPEGAVPFDMYGVELGHQHGRCSFEVIAERFGVAEAGVERLGRLVRAVDLDEPFESAAEAALLARVVADLRAAHDDDPKLLAAGIRFFETLFAAQGSPAPARPQRAR